MKTMKLIGTLIALKWIATLIGITIFSQGGEPFKIPNDSFSLIASADNTAVKIGAVNETPTQTDVFAEKTYLQPAWITDEYRHNNSNQTNDYHKTAAILPHNVFVLRNKKEHQRVHSDLSKNQTTMEG